MLKLCADAGDAGKREVMAQPEEPKKKRKKTRRRCVHTRQFCRFLRRLRSNVALNPNLFVHFAREFLNLGVHILLFPSVPSVPRRRMSLKFHTRRIPQMSPQKENLKLELFSLDDASVSCWAGAAWRRTRRGRCTPWRGGRRCWRASTMPRESPCDTHHTSHPPNHSWIFILGRVETPIALSSCPVRHASSCFHDEIFPADKVCIRSVLAGSGV